MPTVIELTGTPAIYDFEVVQGAVFSRLLTWKDELDAPIDNSTYTARMQVRRHVDSEGDPIVTIATADNVTAEGLITLGGVTGTILLELDAAETAALPATPFDRKWRYDIEMVPAGGEVRRLLMGRFKVSLEVTR